MGYRRYNIQGICDYTGVSLEEIVEDLVIFAESSKDAHKSLSKYLKSVRYNSDRILYSESIIECLLYWESLFKDYESDFRRILKEIGSCIEEKHITLIEEIFICAKNENDTNRRNFKSEFINCDLKDESLRPLIDDIYRCVANQLIRYYNLPGLNRRFKTYIGTSVTKKFQDIVKTKVGIKELFNQSISSAQNWNDVFVTLLGENEIHIKNGKNSRTISNRMMGLENIRKNKPNRLWAILKAFALNKGAIENISINTVEKIKSDIAQLNKLLCEFFSIKENPIKYSKKTKSYLISFGVKFQDNNEESDQNPTLIEEENINSMRKYARKINKAASNDLKGRR